jgi:hypothetical protein
MASPKEETAAPLIATHPVVAPGAVSVTPPATPQLPEKTLSTANAVKADTHKDGGPFVALSPIRHGYLPKDSQNGQHAEVRYLPGETIDLALFTQDALDQLKGSKSIGSKEELTALGKGLAILGTGDGKKTTFDTPFVRSTELTVFVDGSATSGFNTAYAAGPRGVEQIKFAVAPKSGAVITAKADPAAFDLTTLEVKKPQEKFTK